MDKIKVKPGLIVEVAKNKNPLVVVKNVLSCNTNEDILKCLKIQNVDLLAGLSEELVAVVKYRRRARNPQINHVVLQVSPKMWQRLTTASRIHIDLQRVEVQDQTPLIQCSRCLTYGHSRKLCKETADICSHCGGPHLRVDCQSWMAGDTPKCRNCQTAKYERMDHNTFDNE